MGWKKSLTTILKKRTSRALSESDAIANNHRDRNGSIEDGDDEEDDDDEVRSVGTGGTGGTGGTTGTAGGASVATPSPVRRRITNLARRRNRRNKQPNRTPPPYPRKPLVTTPPTDVREASAVLDDEENDEEEEDDGGYSGPRAYLQDGKTTVEGALPTGKRGKGNFAFAPTKIARTRSVESSSTTPSDDGLAHIVKPYLGNQVEQSYTTNAESTDENRDTNAQVPKGNQSLSIKRERASSTKTAVKKELSTLFEKEFEASESSSRPRPSTSKKGGGGSEINLIDTANQLRPVVKTVSLPLSPHASSRELQTDRTPRQNPSTFVLPPSSSDQQRRRTQASKVEKLEGPTSSSKMEKGETQERKEHALSTQQKPKVTVSGFEEAKAAATEAASNVILEAPSSPSRTEASNTSTETDEVATHSSGQTLLLNNGKKKKKSPFPTFVRPPKAAPSHLLRGRSRRRHDPSGSSDSGTTPTPSGTTHMEPSSPLDVAIPGRFRSKHDETEDRFERTNTSRSPSSSPRVEEGVNTVGSEISQGSAGSGAASGSVTTTSTMTTPQSRDVPPRSRNRWGTKSTGEKLHKAEPTIPTDTSKDETNTTDQTLPATPAAVPVEEPRKDKTDSPGDLNLILTPTRGSSVSTVGQYYSDNDNFIVEDFDVEQQESAYPADDDEDSKFYSDAREVLVSDDKSQISGRSAVVPIIAEEKLKRVPTIDGTYASDGGVGIEEDDFESVRPVQTKGAVSRDRVIVVESNVEDDNIDYGKPDPSYADVLEQEAGQEEVVKAAASAVVSAPAPVEIGCADDDDDDDAKASKASGGGSAAADSALSGSDVSSYLPATIDSSTMRNRMDKAGRAAMEKETHAEIPKSVPRVPSRAIRTLKAAKAAAAAAVSPLVTSRQDAVKLKHTDSEKTTTASTDLSLSTRTKEEATEGREIDDEPNPEGKEEASIGSVPSDESGHGRNANERFVTTTAVEEKDYAEVSVDVETSSSVISPLVAETNPALSHGTTLTVEQYLSEVEEEGIETSPDLPPTYSVSSSNGYAATIVAGNSTNENGETAPTRSITDGADTKHDAESEKDDSDAKTPPRQSKTSPREGVSPSSSALNSINCEAVEERLEEIVSPTEMSSHLRLHEDDEEDDDDEDDDEDDDDESDDDVTEVTGYTDHTGYSVGDGSRLSEGDRSRISYILDHPAVAGRASRRRRRIQRDEMSDSSSVREEEEDDEDDDDDDTYDQSEDQESVSVRTMEEDSVDDSVGSASTMLSGHVSPRGKRYADKAAAIRQRGLATKRRADSSEIDPRTNKQWSMSSIVQACYAGLSLPLFEGDEEDEDDAKDNKRRVRRKEINSDDDENRHDDDDDGEDGPSRTTREHDDEDEDDDQTMENRSHDSRQRRRRRDTSGDEDADDRYRIRRNRVVETDGDESTMSRTVTTYGDDNDESTVGVEVDTDGETTVSG